MESDERSKAKDEVYRRIGRNMLLFQRVEQMLKALLNNAQFVGTVSDIKQLKESGPKPDRRMLGELIRPLVENHLTPLDLPPPPPAVGREISFSFKITFEHSPEERHDFQTQLEALVAERNEFVHHLLPKLQLSSIEGCQRASAGLEEQRARILPVRDRVRDLLGRLIESRKVLKENTVTIVEELGRQFEVQRAAEAVLQNQMTTAVPPVPASRTIEKK